MAVVAVSDQRHFLESHCVRHIELIAIRGQRSDDCSLRVGGVKCRAFPLEIHLDGASFDFTEEEEIDEKTNDCLGWYFRRTAPA